MPASSDTLAGAAVPGAGHGARKARAQETDRGLPDTELPDAELPDAELPDAELPDAELMRRHTAGDPDAFGLLFERHRERLWAVAVRTLADPDEAADALQDAMISAFRRAGTFRGDAAVTTWLHRIVVNACLDRLRRRAARPRPDGGEGELDRLAAGPPGADPAEAQETALDVRTALRTLPLDQQAALVLVDMLGYPVADAAAVLNTTQGTIKSRCARGRARLLPRLAHLRPAPAASGPGRNQSSPGRVQADGDDQPAREGDGEAC